ncbi:MAG: hypothetical protein ACLFQJ_08655 [Campylobacterales bacterium]
MHKPFIGRLVSFLIGLSWGVSVFAFIVVFKTFIEYGFLTSFILAIFAFLLGMILLVIFEYISFKVESQKRLEDRLDKIASALSDDKILNN